MMNVENGRKIAYLLYSQSRKSTYIYGISCAWLTKETRSVICHDIIYTRISIQLVINVFCKGIKTIKTNSQKSWDKITLKMIKSLIFSMPYGE